VILTKPAWFDYFAVLGVSQSTVQATGLLGIVGGAELVAGLLVLLFPVPTLLLLLLAAWKIGTELLRPAAGEPFWEFVERASNMLAPLALLYVRIGKPGEGSMPPRLLSNGRTPASNHPPDIRDTAHVDSSSALPAAAAERPRLRNRQTLLRAARNPDGSRPTEWNHPTSLSADRGKRTRKLKLGENGKVGWFSSR
jgi:hypothetical protein